MLIGRCRCPRTGLRYWAIGHLPPSIPDRVGWDMGHLCPIWSILDRSASRTSNAVVNVSAISTLTPLASQRVDNSKHLGQPTVRVEHPTFGDVDTDAFQFFLDTSNDHSCHLTDSGAYVLNRDRAYNSSVPSGVPRNASARVKQLAVKLLGALASSQRASSIFIGYLHEVPSVPCSCFLSSGRLLLLSTASPGAILKLLIQAALLHQRVVDRASGPVPP